MKIDRRTFLAGGSALVLGTDAACRPLPRKSSSSSAYRRTSRSVYTFVTAEYSQGQRDYITLFNERGGINGYKVDARCDRPRQRPATRDRGVRALQARRRRADRSALDARRTRARAAALEDKINMVTTLSGRSDAADGTVFPYVMPLSPNYWTQAGILIDYFRQQDKDLKGKKIVLVHIDTPFGARADADLSGARRQKLGFELQTFPYTPPGNDQSAIWPQVRRAQPDWVIFWGAGVGQTVALSEAMRNGSRIDRSRRASGFPSPTWTSSARSGQGRHQVRGCAGGREPEGHPGHPQRGRRKGKGAGLRTRSAPATTISA